MAVLDHPVHASVCQDADARYGCHNQPRERSDYYAPNRVIRGGLFLLSAEPVPDRMSVECRHDMSLGDPKCEGCKWRGVGEAYWADYRRKLELQNKGA